MERTIIAPEFKGGIWHKFFSTATKKDETLVSILDEKIRYYKLNYPFLEKKQILGKAYEELYIPHICGDVNRKELYKLFLKERKNKSKLKEKHKKYPALFIENKSRNKGTIKKPIIPTTNQVKVNSIRSYIEKSKEDHVFDSLLSNVNLKRKEGVIHNLNLKQTKSVRFNDGIEVHSISPSQPMYKLKPLGRLFDEPSAIRAVDKLPYSQQELKERIEDSDSDFDADTGVTSDPEDYEKEDFPQKEDSSKITEIAENEKIKEKSLLNTKTTTIYDCSEDDSQSMDHEISKEGNDLILSSKIITVVQGKWVRETKQIIGNTYHTKDTMLNRKFVKEDTDDERQEFIMMKNIEYILENIKSLCISNPEECNTGSDTIALIDRDESKSNMNVKSEQLMIGSIKVGKDLTDVEITIQDKNEPKHSKKVCSKIITSKVSLETDIKKHLIDETLLTIDNNKLSYEHDIYEMKTDKEGNTEKRIRTKPIKLVDDLIDYINDWNSSNEGLLNNKANLTSSSEPLHISDPEMDKHSKEREDNEGGNIIEKYCLDNMEEDSSLEGKDCFDQEEGNIEHEHSDQEENKLESISCLDLEEDKLEHKHYLDKEDYNLRDSSLEEKNILNEQNYSPLSIVSNNQLYSQMIESDSSLNTTAQSIEIMKTEPLSDKLQSTKKENETRDNLLNINMLFSKRNEVSEKKEEVNDTYTIIRSMVCNRSTSSPNEVHSTFCSLINKPILIQSQYTEEEDYSEGSYIKHKSFGVQEIDEENKKAQSGYPVSEYEDIKIKEMVKGDNEMHDNANMKPSEGEKNLEENTKVMVEPVLLEKSVINKVSMDNSNSSLPGEGDGDNTLKIFVTDKKLICHDPESILDDMETIEKHEVIKSEKTCTNLSSENLTKTSQSSSMVASCNTDLLQRKTVDIEQSIEANDDNNNSYQNNLSDEDSLASRSYEEDNISGELMNSSTDLETGSSTTVTPIKLGKYNSEEISTAYETDPETGKLVMNRYLRPISSSTPIEQEKIDEPQDSVSKRRLDEHILGESPTHSLHPVTQNKENQDIGDKTKNKTSLNIFVIDESTVKYSHSTNDNVPSQLSSHVSLLLTDDKCNQTLTEIEIKNNKNSEQNYFTESSIEKDNAVISGTDKIAFQQGNIDEPKSESIIENSETDSQKTFKREKDHIVKSHPIYADKHEDNLVLERCTDGTEINSKEISFKQNLENCNTFIISETPEGFTDKQRSSNEATQGSSVQIKEALKSKENAPLDFKVIEKTSADSHSTDIIYDTSNITEDYKFGRNTKTSTVRFASTVEEECKISESENLINENELNISDKFVLTENNKRLSAVSESKIYHDSSIHEKFTSGDTGKVPSSNKMEPSHLADGDSSLNSKRNDSLPLKNKSIKSDLEIQEKKVMKNGQANVSHITFLIRDTMSGEYESYVAEPGHQQLNNPSQLDMTSKIKHGQNKESATSKTLSAPTKIHTTEETHDGHLNETLKVPNSKFLDNNGPHFSLGVENSHIESTLLSNNNEKHKYFTRSRAYLSLKRKLGTIDETYSESDISVSHDEFSGKEMKMNISSSIPSTAAQNSESQTITDTSSIEMSLKRVNTDIRRKRAKLKKETPVRKISTSSSEDEIKKPLLLKGKVLVSSKSAFCKFTESNIKTKQTNKFDHEDCIDTVDKRIQQNAGKSYTNQKDDAPRNFSSLAQSFKNEGKNDSFDDKALNRKKETEYNQLSESSSSIIYSSPNVKTGLQDITKTYEKLKINVDNKINKRHLEEESQDFSGAKSAKTINEKSHKSYPLYRQYDESNKENPNIPRGDSIPNIRNSKNPLRQPPPRKSDTVLDARKDQANETKNPDHSIKKNRKSSIVRLLGTADATQISNSPEVKGLLRRTYFMGNH